MAGISCLLLPYVLSAFCRRRKGIAGQTVLGDERGSEICKIVGKARGQTIVGNAAASAEPSEEILLHRRRREERGWQEDGGCDYFFVGGGPGIGALR